MKTWIALLLGAFAVTGCEKEPRSALDDLRYWKWQHLSSVDPITDVEYTSAILSSGPISDASLAPAELHFRCRAGEFEIYVAWNRYVGPGQQVVSRIDKEAPDTSAWSWSSNGKISFYPRDSIDLADKLSKSKTYVVRVNNRGMELTANFDKVGSPSEISGVRKKCGI